MDRIDVMIVDDHPVFRQGLRNLLAQEEGLHVVGEAADGASAVSTAEQHHPDVVIMDINLPQLNGLQATRALKARSPGTRVIMLTGYDDEEQIYHAIRAGASAYHAKDVEPERLIDLIRQVHQGCYVVEDAVLDKAGVGEWLLERFERFGGDFCTDYQEFLSPLTPREMEILEMVVEGMSNRKIGYDLGISYQTVKNHMTAILRKLRVTGRTEAAVRALQRGWVPLRGAGRVDEPAPGTDREV